MRPLRRIINGNHIRLSTANQFGLDIITGAAGTGKTTTAVHKLGSMYHLIEQQRFAEGDPHPIRVLVLTFNRTLCGYIESYINSTIGPRLEAIVELLTFAKWTMNYAGAQEIASSEQTLAVIARLGAHLPLATTFLASEVEYVLGRFPPSHLTDYLTTPREGRGTRPRVEGPLRAAILNDVILPFIAEMDSAGYPIWQNLASQMLALPSIGYDIVLVDEAQDFSANELRAVRHHLATENYCVTLVADTIQRIYARGYTWKEVGFEVEPNRAHRLKRNYRNTRQIVQFAAGILTGIAPDRDGALPDLTSATEDGPLPIVLRGYYRDQISRAIQKIESSVDLENESVAFLSIGHLFTFLKARLDAANLGYDEITRQREWPNTENNIALITFNSAKGLEFDHVFILGLSDKATPHGSEDQDDRLTTLRRLFAMGVCRARKSVMIGTKPGEESALLNFFIPGTFEEQAL